MLFVVGLYSPFLFVDMPSLAPHPEMLQGDLQMNLKVNPKYYHSLANRTHSHRDCLSCHRDRGSFSLEWGYLMSQKLYPPPKLYHWGIPCLNQKCDFETSWNCIIMLVKTSHHPYESWAPHLVKTSIFCNQESTSFYLRYCLHRLFNYLLFHSIPLLLIGEEGVDNRSCASQIL